MGSIGERPHKPWIETPCVHSAALSREAGCNIYLKLENLQPSSSFKSRGIGHLMSLAIRAHGPNAPIHFYCSSGGNAGLACATAAVSLQRPATIVVPTSTSELIVEKLRTLGADTIVHGRHWVEADAFMRETLIAGDKDAVYVPPFDHEDVWEGNGTIINEAERQMAEFGGYDALVCSVGGGGLFVGIMNALDKHGRLQGGKRGVRVLTMETEGADSLAYSLKNRELSRLPAITSIATSLGATQVCEKAYEWAQRPEVTNCVFSDAEAAIASVCFADDERILTEPACGVSIAPAYNDTLSSLLYPNLSADEFSKINVVIVVCGGSKATLQILQEYQDKYGSDERVLQKFHVRRLAAEKKKVVVENRAKTAPEVPFILHDRKQHDQATEDSLCDDKVSRGPAIGTAG